MNQHLYNDIWQKTVKTNSTWYKNFFMIYEFLVRMFWTETDDIVIQKSSQCYDSIVMAQTSPAFSCCTSIWYFKPEKKAEKKRRAHNKQNI